MERERENQEDYTKCHSGSQRLPPLTPMKKDRLSCRSCSIYDHIILAWVMKRTCISNMQSIHESRFNLWDLGGCIRVRCYAGERCIPECVIERHSGLKPGVMPAHSPDMSLIEHVWDLVERRFARVLLPAA
ncbi:hypothetical protein TNCV_3958651 [Trichonephila clavipes]|nr:hypothetical protein TNCV_3958651 [Trichonephila clavipes]